MGITPRILVTGATGFLGSQVLLQLVNSRCIVGALVRSGSTLAGHPNSTVEHLNADLCNHKDVNDVVNTFNPDTIVHCATRYAVDHTPDETQDIIRTNVDGVIALFEAILSRPQTQVINASTCFVYPEQDQPCREDGPVAPLNLYALTKLQSEQSCSYYANRYGIPVTSLRVFPLYGPGDKERKIVSQIANSALTGKKVAMSDGTQVWDYVYVNDVARAFVLAATTPGPAGVHRIFNAGTGTGTTIRRMAEIISRHTPGAPSLQWGAVARRKNDYGTLVADTTRITAALGWSASTPLEDGLAKTVESIIQGVKK